ncbi:MAG: DUF1269 domain-containing protein [Anaerolineae bacterium]|nr:DUF1269 domain-containing protein [Anaerolineae bacterium]
MSDLIAVAYPNEERANEVLATVRQLQTEYLVDLDDAIVVTKDANGKLKLHQSVNLTAVGAVDGAFWGWLVGLIFTLPFPFMAPVAWLGVSVATAGVGALAGAIGGHFSDYGIDDQFVKDLSEAMSPGSSALFILARKITPDKVIAEISRYGGTVLRTSFSKEAEDQLRAALSANEAAMA